MKADIIKAWTFLRENNNSIPDNVLDFMKDAALEKLEAVAAPPDVFDRISKLVDKGWSIRLYNVCKRIGDVNVDRDWKIRVCYSAILKDDELTHLENDFEGFENTQDAVTDMFAKIDKHDAEEHKLRVNVDEVSAIYEKPMTRELYEGDATVLEILDQDDDSVLCSVKFIKDGMVCTRRISLVETKKEDYV